MLSLTALTFFFSCVCVCGNKEIVVFFVVVREASTLIVCFAKSGNMQTMSSVSGQGLTRYDSV